MNVSGIGPLPRWVRACAERVIAARGTSDVVRRIVERTPVPVVLVDDQRRYRHVNKAARLAFRSSLAELRRRRIDDLTPAYLYDEMEDAWARLMEAGCVAGPYEVVSPDGSRFDITYYALRDAMPGLHLIAFVPAGWSETELVESDDLLTGLQCGPLTPRELEVLQLAADGHNAPAIARELFLSPATVNTHFANIYEKLKVRDRAAAVARGMRLGVIG